MADTVPTRDNLVLQLLRRHRRPAEYFGDLPYDHFVPRDHGGSLTVNSVPTSDSRPFNSVFLSDEMSAVAVGQSLDKVTKDGTLSALFQVSH